MGFGILFFGYFLALPTFANFFYTLIPASVLLAIACRKLARVNIPFLRAFYIACALVPLSLASSLLRPFLATEWIAPYFEAVTLIVWLVWHLFALTGIEWVAQETGLNKLRVKAFRNKIFAAIYLLPAVALTLTEVLQESFPVGIRSLNTGLCIAVYVVGLVVLILNLLLIYSAYARICMPEDAEMPQKPSRFAFVNERRAAAEKREAENAAALEELKARRRARIEEKKDAKKKKRK